MTASLKPYPAYKPSGVEWLGDIPSHWRIGKIKEAIASCTNGVWGSDPDGINDTTCIRVADFLRHNYRVSLKGRTERKIAQSDFRVRNLIPGDLLLEKSGGGEKQLVGQVVSFEYDLPAVCSNFIARLRIHEGFSSRYLVYFNAYLYTIRINYKHIKQTTGIQNLDQNSYLSEYFAYPDEDEQHRIARFLDQKTAEIDEAINKKQRLIDLLKEQKAILINQAVTKGLNPNVPMRDSGVEWIGEVPAHWEVMPLRRVAVSRCDGPFGSGLKSSHYTEQGIRVVRLQNIGHAEFNNSDAVFIAPSHYTTLGDHAVEPEDLLVAGLGDERRPAGRACVAPSFIVPAMVKADCFRFRLFRQRINPEFAALQLTATAINASSFLSTGATRQRTNLQVTAKRPMAIPPTQEQAAIVCHLNQATVGIVAAIDRTRRQIALLQEYRTILIANVVTGKLDVREDALRES